VSELRARAGKRERHERILRDLKLHAAIRVSELARELGVTTETIRRDLDELSDSGVLNRTYGGAALPPAQREPAFQERQRLMIEERSRIGAAASGMIASGEILMVDAGSTTLHFARHLASSTRALTVITNSLPVATTFALNAAIRVILCPGDYNALEDGVFGPHTIDFIRRFNANHAVIGASGLDRLGATDALTEAVGVKQAMLERAQRKMLLVDAGKFEAAFLERVCPLADLTDIVADRAPPDALAEAIRAAGVKLHVAPAAKSGGR
jgi:DeoR family transcriptional regulator, glycerol-3-phosphate regulon repressor